jgi:hypothetical protein
VVTAWREVPVSVSSPQDLAACADVLLGHTGEDSYAHAMSRCWEYPDPEGREEVLIDDIDCDLSVSGYTVTFNFNTRVWRIDHARNLPNCSAENLPV